MLSIKNSITETESIKIKQAKSNDSESSLDQSPNPREKNTTFIKFSHQFPSINP
jgi:hypothetical protein